MARKDKKGRNAKAEAKRIAHKHSPRKLTKNPGFDLENQAIQQILDNVIRLQTFLALRSKK
ncbi:hypothetical protein [Neopusillimonas maritima]|uniref:Uncharacterized protein n=1 Tax=Neopusillimonas maritima TaxID=2026239 RepID=A0A3A1YXT5_9BURK|nr:hypothetical protein [Neopusillimonas maritima]RIY41978.1 hypothetical protein CJP73_00590 [Neopusillimonas maritima]